MLFFIIVLTGAYAAVAVYQQKNLTAVVQEASAEQQASITAVSELTLETPYRKHPLAYPISQHILWATDRNLPP